MNYFYTKTNDLSVLLLSTRQHFRNFQTILISNRLIINCISWWITNRTYMNMGKLKRFSLIWFHSTLLCYQFIIIIKLLFYSIFYFMYGFLIVIDRTFVLSQTDKRLKLEVTTPWVRLETWAYFLPFSCWYPTNMGILHIKFSHFCIITLISFGNDLFSLIYLFV